MLEGLFIPDRPEVIPAAGQRILAVPLGLE